MGWIPKGVQEIGGFFRDLVDVHGRMMFLSSHLLGEVEPVCVWAAILHHGRVLREGKARELLAAAAKRLRVQAASLPLAMRTLQDDWQAAAEAQDEGMALVWLRGQA